MRTWLDIQNICLKPNKRSVAWNLKILSMLKMFYNYIFTKIKIHGYDINSIKFYPVHLKDKDICDTLICGADEKVVRLFEPPATFVNAVNLMSNKKLHLYFENEE